MLASPPLRLFLDPDAPSLPDPLELLELAVVVVALPAVTTGLLLEVEEVLFPPPSDPEPEVLLPWLEEVLLLPLMRLAAATLAAERLV